MDFRPKAVPALRDRFDVLPTAIALAERLAEREDVDRQVAVFDKRVRPDLLEELFLFYCTAAATYEHQKSVECFRSERDRASCAAQDPFRGIQSEGTELVEVLWVLIHSSFQLPLRTI